MTASVIINFQNTSPLKDAYWTSSIALGALAALTLLGYLVLASEPKGEDVTLIVLGGMVCAVAWPGVVVIGALTGIVLGLRRIIHRPRAEITEPHPMSRGPRVPLPNRPKDSYE